jgi:hypothetical protein
MLKRKKSDFSVGERKNIALDKLRELCYTCYIGKKGNKTRGAIWKT